MINGITIDLRMYKMSGIGRYLQTVMPKLVPQLNAQRIRILGNDRDLEGEGWLRDPRIQFLNFRFPIFSSREQWAGIWGPYRAKGLLWVPHFNIPLGYRGRIVVTIHDVCQLAYPELLGSDLQRWYARRLLSSVAARAEVILCDSQATQSEIQKYLNVDKSRLVVVYPGIEEDSRDIGLSRSESELPNRPFLLSVGNVKRHKNLKSLITAFDRIRDRIPHNLIVVGKQEGFLNSEADLSAASTISGGRVRFTGHISDRELTQYYRKADGLIFPSIYEGFGYPIIEAMAHGCPVACSNVSSLPEVAGNAALLFDPFSIDEIGSAIVKIATDLPLRSNLVTRGFERAELFGATVCANEIAAVMNGLLGA
jgi:glycosyltransferase involved in cell wall biosynthesis